MAFGLLPWMQESYDRLIALLVLAVLLATLVVLGTQAQTLRQRHAEDGRAVAALKAVHPTVTPVDRSTFDRALAALSNPYQIGTWSNRMFSPEPRIRCIKCGRPIPLAATVCPFEDCRAAQKVQPAQDKDTDRDGMPDWWEKKYKFNAMDPNDAGGDADRDGFSNVEEYRAGTDPADAKSHPPYWWKMVVKSINPKPFALMFMGVSEIGSHTLLFQINLRSDGRTYWKRLGEDVEGFKLADYAEKGAQGKPTLTLQRGEKRIPLIQREAVPYNEFEIDLTFLIDNTDYKVGVPSKLTVRDATYEVKEVDSAGGRVLIHDPGANRDVWIDSKPAGERRENWTLPAP